MTSSSRTFLPMTGMQFLAAVGAMCAVVVGSNILVQFPINQWLTWGAISYPIAFLVSDLLNRRFGPSAARRVVVVGFIAAVVFSVWAATPRIALASGMAFLFAQLLDITVFNRLREQRWWRAPLLAGVAGATLDTCIFFSVAFAGTGIDWVSLLTGDLAVKLVVNATMLVPFRVLMWNLGRPALLGSGMADNLHQSTQ